MSLSKSWFDVISINVSQKNENWYMFFNTPSLWVILYPTLKVGGKSSTNLVDVRGSKQVQCCENVPVLDSNQHLLLASLVCYPFTPTGLKLLNLGVSYNPFSRSFLFLKASFLLPSIRWTSRASCQAMSSLSYAQFTLGCSLSTF